MEQKQMNLQQCNLNSIFSIFETSNDFLVVRVFVPSILVQC